MKGNFSAEKIDPDQVAVKPESNEQSVSTNAQAVTREDVQTAAENQDKLGGGLHTGLHRARSLTRAAACWSAPVRH